MALSHVNNTYFYKYDTFVNSPSITAAANSMLVLSLSVSRGESSVSSSHGTWVKAGSRAISVRSIEIWYCEVGDTAVTDTVGVSRVGGGGSIRAIISQYASSDQKVYGSITVDGANFNTQGVYGGSLPVGSAMNMSLENFQSPTNFTHVYGTERTTVSTAGYVNTYDASTICVGHAPYEDTSANVVRDVSGGWVYGMAMEIVEAPIQLPPNLSGFTDNQGAAQSTDTVIFDSSTIYDQNGTIASYLWTVINAPGVTISNPTSGTIASFLVPIVTEATTYTFEVTVTDDDGASSSKQFSYIIVPYTSPDSVAVLEDSSFVEYAVSSGTVFTTSLAPYAGSNRALILQTATETGTETHYISGVTWGGVPLTLLGRTTHEVSSAINQSETWVLFEEDFPSSVSDIVITCVNAPNNNFIYGMDQFSNASQDIISYGFFGATSSPWVSTSAIPGGVLLGIVSEANNTAINLQPSDPITQLPFGGGSEFAVEHFYASSQVPLNITTTVTSSNRPALSVVLVPPAPTPIVIDPFENVKYLDNTSPAFPDIVKAWSGHPIREYFYELGNPIVPIGTQPKNLAFVKDVEGASWTPQQGIARNATHWFEINTTSISRHTLDGLTTITNSSPFTGLPAGVDHCGASFEHNDMLYVPIVNWDGATQTATSQCIAVFDTSDLSLITFLDISAQSVCNASALCLTPDASEIWCTSFFRGNNTDNRTTDIYRYSSAGAFLGTHTLNIGSQGIQGIRCTDKYIYITSWVDDTSDGSTINIYDLSLNLITNMDMAGFQGEIEGIEIYEGKVYTHLFNTRIVEVDFNAVFIGKSTTNFNPVSLISSTDINQDSGTLIIKVLPYSVFDFNSIFDNNSAGNEWESWVYLDGRLAFRQDSSNQVITPSGFINPKEEYVIAYSWEVDSTTSTLKVFANGVSGGTNTGPTVSKPTSGLSLAGINSSNNQGNNNYYDIVILDRALNDTELGLYTTQEGLRSLYTYDAPSGVAFDAIQADFTVAASKQLPANSSGDIAFDAIQADFTVAASKQLPANSSGDIAFDAIQADFTVEASKQLPANSSGAIAFDAVQADFIVAASKQLPANSNGDTAFDAVQANFIVAASKQLPANSNGAIAFDAVQADFIVAASKQLPANSNGDIAFDAIQADFIVAASKQLPAGSGAFVSLNLANALFSVAASKQLPANSSGAIAFDTVQADFTVAASKQLPANSNGAIAFDAIQADFSVAASKQLPAGSGAFVSLGLTNTLFSVSASTESPVNSVDIAFDAIQADFIVAASKQLPILTTTIAFDTIQADFTVAASKQLPTGSGAFVSLNLANALFSVAASKQLPANSNGDIAFDVIQTEFTVAASKQLPANSSGDIAFDAAQANFIVAASKQLPTGSGAFVSLNLTNSLFSVAASRQLPPSSTGSISFIKTAPVFSVIADSIVSNSDSIISFEITSPQFTSVATNVVPEYVSTVAIALNTASLGITASKVVPTFGTFINLLLPVTTFSATGTNTTPNTESTAHLNIAGAVFKIRPSAKEQTFPLRTQIRLEGSPRSIQLKYTSRVIELEYNNRTVQS